MQELHFHCQSMNCSNAPRVKPAQGLLPAALSRALFRWGSCLGPTSSLLSLDSECWLAGTFPHTLLWLFTGAVVLY